MCSSAPRLSADGDQRNEKRGSKRNATDRHGVTVEDDGEVIRIAGDSDCDRGQRRRRERGYGERRDRIPPVYRRGGEGRGHPHKSGGARGRGGGGGGRAAERDPHEGPDHREDGYTRRSRGGKAECPGEKITTAFAIS